MIELLLVLALLTVVAAITWPEVSQLYAQHEIKQTALLVQRYLLAARVEGLRHAVPYEFRYEPGGRSFWIHRLADVREPGAPCLVGLEPRRQGFADYAGTLPSGLRFIESHELPAGSRSGQNAYSLTAPTTSSPGTGWSEPIIFLPDGTATQAELRIADSHGFLLRISVERLTGAVRTAAVDKFE